MIEFPQAEGALYIASCEKDECLKESVVQVVEIINSNFIANQVGPAVFIEM